MSIFDTINNAISGLTNRAVPAPVVINTNQLREKIQKNTDYLNKAQTAFFPTPTGASIPTPALTPNTGVSSTATKPQTIQPTAQTTANTTNTPSAPTQQTPTVQPIQNTFKDNPALSSAVDQLNATISTFKGQMTPEQQALYNSIKSNSERYASSVAEAQSAKESGDMRTFNEKVNEAKVASDLRTTEINKLFTDMKDLRERYIESLTPTQAETDLETQLADLRTSAELGAEAQYGLGRPLALATGRAEKVLNQGAIQEKNLLAKLGIEVKKREAKSKGLEAGLGFLSDDIQLQMKVQERLDKQQEQILARVDKLNDNQRQAMASLADKFKDIDLSTASPEVIRGIQQFALNQGVDAALAIAIVEGAYNQQFIDNAIKGTTAGIGGVKSTIPIVNTILGSGKFTKDQARMITSSIESGEDPFTVVKNRAKDILTGNTANLLEKNEAARDAMYELDKAFKEYYASGGDSGIIKGTMEDVVNRLGEVRDPKLAGLGVQVSAALQKYRNAISGTAYSKQEGREIKKVFPGIEKGQILNDATIKARLKVFESDIDSTYRSVLGKAYDEMKGASTQSTGEVDISDLDFTF